MMKRLQPPFLILCLLGGLLAFTLAWVPVPVSISHFIVEDMFYYLQAARHLNAGDVASLDGVHATNGFHPLWMVVSRWVERLPGGDENLPVHLALTIAALSFVLTGGVLFLCLRKTMAISIALPLTAWFLFNYRMMTIPLGGLESGIAGLSVGLLTCFLLSHQPGWKASILLGLLLGLACLSRLDALLLTGIVLAWWCFTPLLLEWRTHSPSDQRKGDDREENKAIEFVSPWGRLLAGICSGTLAGLVCLVSLVPWFIFSWKTSHTLLPNSRVAIESWKGFQWVSGMGLTGNLMSLAKSRIGVSIEPLNDMGALLGVWPFASPEIGNLRYLGALVTTVSFLVLLVIVWKGHRLSGFSRMGWVPVYVVAHCGYYVAFGHVGIRYYYPTFLPLVVWIGTCAGALIRNARDVRRAVNGCTLVVTLLIGGATLAGMDSFRKGQATGRFHPLHLGLYNDLAPWLSANTPPESRVGSFNAGILSYYSGRKVVNLDGVMNDSVIPAIQNKHLARYIEEQGISYLADAEVEITKFMDRFGGDPDWTSKWETVYLAPAHYRGGTASKTMVVMKRK